MNTGRFIAHQVSACHHLVRLVHFLLACNDIKISQVSLLGNTPTASTWECATHSVRRHLPITMGTFLTFCPEPDTLYQLSLDF